jgi:small subunit ribosomal protein S21
MDKRPIDCYARASFFEIALFMSFPHWALWDVSSGDGPLGLGGLVVQIFVRDNNVDQALKALKKKMQREGAFREMKRHVHYEKPSEKRARQKAEAVRRARKLARKRAQREGLIAAPKKVVRA